jgi:Zn-finger domain-containing protein
MAFQKTKDGVRDSRINVKGRIVREKPLNRELKERYLVELLRKLRPLQAQSITKVARILNDDKATDQNALKAAAMLITLYKDLVKDAYGRDEETEDELSVDAIQENKPQQPKFSLVMLPSAVPKEDTKE